MSERFDDGLAGPFSGEVEFVVRIRREQFAKAFSNGLGAGQSRPLTVDQRTCAQIIGIPRRQFLQACRDGAFPFRADGKRRIAFTADVERYWTRGISSATGGAAANETGKAPPSTTPQASSQGSEPTQAALDAAARLRGKYRLMIGG